MKKILHYLARMLEGWNLFEKIVISVVILIIPIGMAFEAFSRLVLQSTPTGLEEFILLVAAYGYFIGAAHASRTRKHITVTILDVIKLSDRVKHYLSIFSTFLCFVLPLVFSYYAVDYVIFLAKQGVMLVPFRWPIWVMMVAMPIGLITLGMYELRNLIQTIRSKSIEETELKTMEVTQG
jgi:C4-dicarboxylate transporter DctQ subunit